MFRLTNKECYSYEDFVFSLRNKLITPSEIDNDIYKKLKSLEDIEEELGIDLIFMFKILKNRRIMYKHDVGIIRSKIIIDEFEIYGLAFDDGQYTLWIYNNYEDDCLFVCTKDYGKTWALTKEELEDDN